MAMTVALAVPARAGSKAWFRGTHRACAPDDTWSRIGPLLRPAGITRVGEITRLDDVGVATMQAVRPQSRSLAVTIAAGVTPMLARVGAAMSALELWHAERLLHAPHWASLGEVRADLGYNPEGLPLHTPHLLNDGMVLDWVPATALLSGRSTMLPRACVEYDLSVRDEWAPPVFVTSADGLAAGNSHAEAVLHALYEVIERDCVARARIAGVAVRLDPAGVEGHDARRMLDRFAAAGVRLRIFDVTGPTDVAAFAVAAESDGGPPAHGAACHLDREVALCRALCAAARERLARIVGARDDLPLHPEAANHAGIAGALDDAPAVRAFADVPSLTTSNFAGDIAELADRLRRGGAGPALVVDLSRESIGLPVARVVVPGLRRHLDR
jgi:ribosomal protein S12 methylthiotransferase accessory factor